MYKKVWLGLLTAAMVAGLTACGSKAAEETTAKAAGDSVDGEVTIHLMMSNSQELGVSAAVEAFNKALDNRGMNNNVVIQASGDISQLISYLNFELKKENSRIGDNMISGSVYV